MKLKYNPLKAIGLISVEFPASELQLTLKWLSKNFDYSYKAFEYFSRSSGQQFKNLLLVNRGGGLPLFVKQSFSSQEFWFNDLVVGDLGVLAFKLGVADLQKVYLSFKTQKLPVFSKVLADHENNQLFWVKDPFANNFVLAQKDKSQFFDPHANIGGIYGLLIGVNDLDQAVEFYSALGYDLVTYLDYFDDLKPLFASDFKVRRAILQLKERSHLFSKFTGTTELDLVEVKSFKNPKISPFNLVFLLDEMHKPLRNFHGLQVVDKEQFTVSKTYLFNPYTGQNHLLVDVVRLNINGMLNWNLKYPSLKLNPDFKLKFVVNNALEKI